MWSPNRQSGPCWALKPAYVPQQFHYEGLHSAHAFSHPPSQPGKHLCAASATVAGIVDWDPLLPPASLRSSTPALHCTALLYCCAALTLSLSPWTPGCCTCHNRLELGQAAFRQDLLKAAADEAVATQAANKIASGSTGGSGSSTSKPPDASDQQQQQVGGGSFSRAAGESIRDLLK